MGNNCSILVTSCDKYEDAWKPFFALLHIMWSDCEFPVYLNTETKDFSIPEIKITSLHPKSLLDKKGRNISWSKRLKDAVEQIDSEYILCFLEDFFLMSPVRKDVIDDCIRWMEQDTSIGMIDFFHEPCLQGKDVGEFAPVDPKYGYCINAMSALWRKSFLLSILREDENPWDFEFNGTYRWRRTNNKIFTHKKEFPSVLDYPNIPKFGYGIYQGKWLWNNKALFEKYGIEADFSKRLTLQYEDLPPLEAREREKHWIIADIGKTIRHPSLIVHYCDCIINILKAEKRKLCAILFHR